ATVTCSTWPIIAARYAAIATSSTRRLRPTSPPPPAIPGSSLLSRTPVPRRPSMPMRIISALDVVLLAVPVLGQQSGRPPGFSGGGSSFGGAPQKGTGGGGAAAKKPEPGSLEDLLDKALRNNADIRAAEAKVREAEAELNRVRHQVLAKIVGARNDIDAAKKM